MGRTWVTVLVGAHCTISLLIGVVYRSCDAASVSIFTWKLNELSWYSICEPDAICGQVEQVP